MSDDEARIERLTAIALRVWPDARVITWSEHAYVEDETLVQRASVYGHPRALNALEAALLVLAGEGHISYSVAAPGLSEKLEALTAPHCQPAWVEKLAREWEERGARCTSDVAERCGPVVAAAVGPVLEPLVRSMAAELRERAKGADRG